MYLWPEPRVITLIYEFVVGCSCYLANNKLAWLELRRILNKHEYSSYSWMSIIFKSARAKGHKADLMHGGISHTVTLTEEFVYDIGL